jgi:hypothetical protein
MTAPAVARGIELRRIKRETNIKKGLSERVVLTPRQQPTGRNRFKMIRGDEADIKDPIKRAGRRLLSKSAIPIQCAARRYLAKREALDRMWAIIQVQSYFRRWRCEANFQAHVHAATSIQKIARCWLARQNVKDSHAAATSIQKMVRGYLAAAHAYDAIYYICRLQALTRGYLTRLENARREEAAATLQAFYLKLLERKVEAAIIIQKTYRGHKIYKALHGMPHVIGLQTLYRGYKARKDYTAQRSSATKIQTIWRSYYATIDFQMQVADIITAQSIVRRWSALREAELLRLSANTEAVISIQSMWRLCLAKNELKRHRATRKIQSTWRGYQAYTDYVFLIVDVLVVQRKIRQWLAIQKVQGMRKEKAAVVVQTSWRRHQAQRNLVLSLANIIIVQSVARRFLSKSTVVERKNEAAKMRAIREGKDKAAIVIQKMWRGFWEYSHFIIIQYEITRVQALVRARLARQKCYHRLACVLLIQAVVRGYLGKKALTKKKISAALIASRAEELRERNSAKRIQFWWRIVLDWTKEKKAALTIERFFIFVKKEVDREIRRREMKRLAKEKKRRKEKRRSEDQLLEKAWLNTVDENLTAGSFSSEEGTTPRNKRSSSTPRSSQTPVNRIPPVKGVNPKVPVSGISNPSPRRGGGMVGRFSIDPSGYPKPPTDSVQLSASGEDFSVVSNITNPSVFHKMSKHQLLKSNNTDITEELDFLDEPFHQEERPRTTKNEKHRLTTEDYIRKYGGLNTAPNRVSKSGSSDHFFSEEGSGMKRQISNGTPTSQSRTQGGGTPRSHNESASSTTSSSKRRSSSSGGKPMSIATGPVVTNQGSFEPAPRVPSTPRSTTSNSRTGPSPKNFGISGKRLEGSSPPYLPPTPNSRHHNTYKGGNIARRGTCETESQTTMSETIYSMSSPRRHSSSYFGDGGGIHRNNQIMIMKTYPELEDGQSIQEAHEMLLLGDEYGEV